ncbi:putative ribonuclease H-like domain, reverse transcriptase zinc-binding domain-containing protein [Senna tora]|uniref:Putative ribonuclease H-like domain, reverse transcriptase zinc-binding domain-containing protein n=1 Tax=Senna tora TaxID=362788 RepID=A0A834WT57_9FABA|nr:putative ribonuclease H-like domain, reverse transcriptase zinc-binding domain-containing protein [Senna tora]
MLSRYKVFLWRVCWGIKPTVEALEHRGMEINEECPMCDLEPKIVFHALIDCPEIQLMCVMANFDYSSRVYHANVLKWMVVEASSWSDEKLCKAAVAMYCVWEGRNAKKFSNEVIPAENLWPKVERIMDEYQAPTLTDSNNVTTPTILEWEKPEYPLVKLNVDAATSKDGGGYLGSLVQDSEGCCLGGFMGLVYAPNDAVLLKAMAVRRGLELALKIGCTHILVEGDASMVIEMLKTPCTQASVLNAARIDQRDVVWIDSVPFFLSEVLSFDE